MANTEVPAVDTGQAQREAAATSGSLLSKFGRSPSRKHKARPSSESGAAFVTASMLQQQQAPQPQHQQQSQQGQQQGPPPGSYPSRPRHRPGPSRTTTAPAASVTLNSIRAELVSRHDTEGGGQFGADMYTGTTVSPAMSGPPSANRNGSIQGIPEVPQVNGGAHTTQPMMPPAAAGPQNPNTLFQHIHDMSSKRIATLDYMRKAHEGRTFWFNTVQFPRSDISKLPSYTPHRLSRRATNYLLLGMSIPAVLDVHPPPHPSNSTATNSAIAHDFLRNLNNLLTEFESFQQLHPPDGSTASSLSRARIPQMFKRAATNTKSRKSTGGVAEIGLPLQQAVSPPAMTEGGHGHAHQPSLDTNFSGTTFASSATSLVAPTPTAPSPATAFPTASAFPPPGPYDAPNTSLLPNEGPYTYLLTPPLPFAPDFYAVFATLCDVLIDAYHRLLQLLSSPAVCTATLSDMFSKADARLRKVMVGGIVREFENSSRDSAKRELMGVQKVVLGGLMGT